MSAQESQVVDPQELIPICDYTFSGDNRTVSNKSAFVQWYRRKASIYHAALAAQVARSTVYKWIEEDPQFALAVEESFEDAADAMETSTYEEALGTKDKAGNPLLKMFWLKAHRPKYRDRVSVDVEVVRSEIEQRMATLNLDRLPQLPPALMSEFIPVGRATESMQFPSQCEQIQKEVDSGSSTESSSSE